MGSFCRKRCYRIKRNAPIGCIYPRYTRIPFRWLASGLLCQIIEPNPAWVRLAKRCGMGLRARLASSIRQAPFSGSFGQSSDVKARHSSGFIWLRASCRWVLGFIRLIGARDLQPDGVVRLNRLRGPKMQSGDPCSTFRRARGASAHAAMRGKAMFLLCSTQPPDCLQGNFHTGASLRSNDFRRARNTQRRSCTELARSSLRPIKFVRVDKQVISATFGPVAQGIEQQPSKLKVAGSNPAGVTRKINDL